MKNDSNSRGERRALTAVPKTYEPETATKVVKTMAKVVEAGPVSESPCVS